MKKILIVLIAVVITMVPSYAEGDIEIPSEIIGILEENGVNNVEKIEVSDSIELLIIALKDGLLRYSCIFNELMALILVIAVFRRLFDNYSNLSIINGVYALVVSSKCFLLVKDIVIDCSGAIEESTGILKCALPGFVSAIAFGGGSSSTVLTGSSFASVIGILQVLVSDVLGAFAIVLSVFWLFENIAPMFNDFGIVKRLKKHLITAISFVTTLFLSIMSFQNIISARADSMAFRTVRFASASFIPIVGSAVGEALRTLSNGGAYLKSTLGISVGLALCFTFLPVLISLFIIKLMFTFFSFVGNCCGCKNEVRCIDGIGDIADVFISIIICSTLLSMSLVMFFVFVVFSV